MKQDQGILDNISTGIVALDDKLRVTALNAAGQALLETSESRCIGQHAGKLVLHPREWLTTLEQVMASKSPHASRSMSLMLPFRPGNSCRCDHHPGHRQRGGNQPAGRAHGGRPVYLKSAAMKACCKPRKPAGQ